MEGLYTEIYRGKEIVVIDYSVIPHELEFELMKASLTCITGYEKSSASVLEIISGVKLSKEILDYFPYYYKEIKSHVWKWASVGFGELIFKEMVANKLIDEQASKNKNIQWFETKEEALSFLT
ncbi:hypothetical protein [Ekhidna sp.]|uniref:hypothetical protein n=1 Tax=Ekhidna sp. TaxID=2608089 RepID=UPI003297D2BA